MTPAESDPGVIDRLAAFLKSIVQAWRKADLGQRNRLTRQLFEEIWLQDKQMVAVKPRPELGPFFRLSFDKWRKKFESDASSPLEGAFSAVIGGTVDRQRFAQRTAVKSEGLVTVSMNSLLRWESSHTA